MMACPTHAGDGSVELLLMASPTDSSVDTLVMPGRSIAAVGSGDLLVMHEPTLAADVGEHVGASVGALVSHGYLLAAGGSVDILGSPWSGVDRLSPCPWPSAC